MLYINRTLTFTDTEIYYDDDGKFEVMMDWEDSIMQASADYVCENGGDILEIGFGMGISANYIQANSINSHTIVENHPQIIEKLNIWAADKPNVTVIEGDWFEILLTTDKLSTYDGIFYDTYGDEFYVDLKDKISDLAKPGCKTTWWNNISEENNLMGIEDVIYEKMTITPPNNNYFNHDYYYLPKKQY